MLDHATLIRQALITALKQSVDVSSVFGDRVYDEVSASPTWPLIRIAPPTKEYHQATCEHGYEMEWRINLFVRGPGTKDIGGAESKVFTLLENIELFIPGLRSFSLDFVRSFTGHDADEVSDYHCVMVYTTTSGEEYQD